MTSHQHKCKECGTDRKLISCLANGGARIWLCVECLAEKKTAREIRR